MDRKWSKVESPEEEAAIPPLPTRAEELAYLDKFERELRNLPYYKTGFPPDPSRKYILYQDELEREYKAKRLRTMLVSGLLFSPVAFWLTEKSPAKACPMGIPYRNYPFQHKLRFWSFFIFYEAVFTYTYFFWTMDKKTLERSMWPLNKIRERQL